MWHGHNNTHMVLAWDFQQRNLQMYGHIRCTYTVLASPEQIARTKPGSALLI
jgi:hypothetical protein